MYTPVRLGFPRETLEGATYKGISIPKGTVSNGDFAASRDAVLTSIAHYHEPLRSKS
jgi:hypothetical protein